jgi:anti-anti-sigma factor
MKLVSPPDDGQHVLVLSGPLDGAASEYLRDAGIRLALGAPEALIVDLSEVTSIDGSALRALISVRMAAVSCGAQVVLRHPAQCVSGEMQRAGVLDLFPIEY